MVKTETADTSLAALKLLASQRPLVIGHRGCCQFAPENTLPSFTLALEVGVDLVELDYRHSKDGVPVFRACAGATNRQTGVGFSIN